MHLVAVAERSLRSFDRFGAVTFEVHPERTTIEDVIELALEVFTELQVFCFTWRMRSLSRDMFFPSPS